MKHSKWYKTVWIALTAVIALAMMAGGAFAQSSGASQAVPETSTVDFEGLAAGTIVSSISSGQGMSGNPVPGLVASTGSNPAFGTSPNAAMIFDSTCPPLHLPRSCSGEDRDLFKPELGKVLIISEDMDSSDPDDADLPGAYFDFDFTGWGNGLVTVKSLQVMDVEVAQGEGGAHILLYSGGVDGTLLRTVDIPNTGNNGLATIAINVPGVDFMRVTLNGSGAIDNLVVHPEDILYLSDTHKYKDGVSGLYRVVLDPAAGRANLILLPNGVVKYDNVYALAATPDGSRLYFINSDGPNTSVLAYYDVAAATVHEIGQLKVNGQGVVQIHQASFSPGGILYITTIKNINMSVELANKLYTVNLGTAEMTEVGLLVNQATGATLNISAGDIAFKSDGTLYLFFNPATSPGAPRGLYTVSQKPINGKVNATFLNNPSDESHTFRGLGFRWGGTGALVGSTITDEIHVHNPATGQNVISPLPTYFNGANYDLHGGDMSTGPFLP